MRKLITKERLEQRKRENSEKALHPQEKTVTITTGPKYRLKNVMFDAIVFDKKDDTLNMSVSLIPVLEYVAMNSRLDEKEGDKKK